MDPVVIWTSALGTFTAILGMILGVWMYSPGNNYRHAGVPTSISYHGWKRWHTIIGLIFGSTAATWAFSGFLSMNPYQGRVLVAATPVSISPWLFAADSL